MAPSSRRRAGAIRRRRVRRHRRVTRVPDPRMDRRGPPGRVDRALPRRSRWPRSTMPARRASAARTGARPAAGGCRTTRNRTGRRSTRRAGCSRSPGSRGTPPALPDQHDRPAGARRRIVGTLRHRRAAGTAPRRPVGRQPARRRDGPQLADRPGRPRRPPRVRPRHDAAVRRLLAGVLRGYDERHPLSPGWQERVTLHQIAPLVVHAIKFGGGYVAAAARAIARYV